MNYTDVDSTTLDLFEEVKQDFPDVSDAKFKLLFRDKKKGSDTEIVLAEICKFSTLVKHITKEIPDYCDEGLHYCIIIDKIAWECFSQEEQRMVLFHEMCHTKVTFKEEGTDYGLRDHTIKDFQECLDLAEEKDMKGWSQSCCETALAKWDELKEEEKAKKKAAKKKK